MSTSLPSLPVTTVDVPEIAALKAAFTYNFFTRDELVVAGETSSVSVPGSVGFIRATPRFVRLSWDKVRLGSRIMPQRAMTDISIQQNATRVVEETQLSQQGYVPVVQQENSFVTTRREYLSRLYEQLNIDRTNAGMVDAIRSLHESTPEGVTQEFLTRYLNYSQSENTATSQTPTDPADSFESLRVTVPVSTKVVGTLFHEKLVNDSLTPLSPDLSAGLSSLFGVQSSVVSVLNRFNGSQYDLNLTNSITSVVSDLAQDNGIAYETTGYVIERQRQLPGTGELVEKRVFYVESPETTELIDTGVLYNQTYVYVIKVIVAVQKLMFDSALRVNTLQTFLLASRPTRAVVVCQDKRPAEPPTDFFVTWDYGLQKPILTWNFPNDTRRHIKYFQVFRRENAGGLRPVQRPFELVRMFDFNDLEAGINTFFVAPEPGTAGDFRFLQGEGSIDSSLVVNENTSRGQAAFSPTFYVDEDFDKEKYYIYAVAAVDAHGVSTNYSNQIGVKFDKDRNTIARVDISSPGAPKPYPNLYLNRDTFVDTIKTEGMSQMTVVFNPEYLELTRQGKDPVKLIEFGPDNKYRIQLINTDIQTDQFVDVTITDNRQVS